MCVSTRFLCHCFDVFLMFVIFVFVLKPCSLLLSPSSSIELSLTTVILKSSTSSNWEVGEGCVGGVVGDQRGKRWRTEGRHGGVGGGRRGANGTRCGRDVCSLSTDKCGVVPRYTCHDLQRQTSRASPGHTSHASPGQTSHDSQRQTYGVSREQVCPSDQRIPTTCPSLEHLMPIGRALVAKL